MLGLVDVVKFVRRIGAGLTIVAMVVFGLITGLTACNSSSLPETPAKLLSEVKLRDNNLLLEGLTQELVDYDIVFKQAFFMLTYSTIHSDQPTPTDPESPIYINCNPGEMLVTMRELLNERRDEEYRNSLAALIFSALPMQSRQALVDELGPDDPILSDEEVIPLLPSSNQASFGAWTA